MNTEQLKTAEQKRSALIQEHLQRFGENNLFRASLDNFRETGAPSGSFRAALHALMQDFASQESKRAVDEFKEQLAKKGELDQFLEVNQKLIFTECQKAVCEFKEKLKESVLYEINSSTSSHLLSRSRINDLIDKL